MLVSKTRGNSSINNKPRVYCSGLQADTDMYFAEISELVLSLNNCVVYRDENVDEYDIQSLRQMQLFVIIITKAYIEKNDISVLELAKTAHIPVLPLIAEELDPQDMRCLNELLGNMQCIDIRIEDDTAISLDVKLKNFINSILVDSVLVEQIRSAFSKYIFLSYRKKNREHANALMRKIHSFEDLEDVGIWYDEFLEIGENYNEGIASALKDCDLVTLLVTPDILEEGNYVKIVEYPEAVKSDKPVIPIEMVKTDMQILKAGFGGIADCIDKNDDEGIHKAISSVIRPDKNRNDPFHLYYTGLGYLNGIFVEKDLAKAEKLITRSAEANNTEAMYKLFKMYRDGEGVEKNIEKAVHWLTLYKEIYSHIYSTDKNFNNALSYLDTLNELVQTLTFTDMTGECEEACSELLNSVNQIMEVDGFKSSIFALYSVNAMIGLANCHERRGDKKQEICCLEEAYEYCEYAIPHTRSEEGVRLLTEKRIDCARRLSRYHASVYDYDRAKKYSDITDEKPLQEINPVESIDFFINKARSLVNTGYYDSALESIDEGIAICTALRDEYIENKDRFSSALAECMSEKVRILAIMGRNQEAVKLIADVIDMCDLSDWASLTLADRRSLIEYCRKAVKLASLTGNEEFGRTLMPVYLEMAQYSYKMSDEPEIHRDLARTYFICGQFETRFDNNVAAIKYFQNARAVYKSVLLMRDSFGAVYDIAEVDGELRDLCFKIKLYDVSHGYSGEIVELLENIDTRSDFPPAFENCINELINSSFKCFISILNARGQGERAPAIINEAVNVFNNRHGRTRSMSSCDRLVYWSELLAEEYMKAAEYEQDEVAAKMRANAIGLYINALDCILHNNSIQDADHYKWVMEITARYYDLIQNVGRYGPAEVGVIIDVFAYFDDAYAKTGVSECALHGAQTAFFAAMLYDCGGDTAAALDGFRIALSKLKLIAHEIEVRYYMALNSVYLSELTDNMEERLACNALAEQLINELIHDYPENNEGYLAERRKWFGY